MSIHIAGANIAGIPAVGAVGGEIRLVTGLGIQTVKFESLVNAHSITMSDVLALRGRLSVALSHNWNEIMSALGAETFSRFFDPKVLSGMNPGGDLR